jgi:hypothetical protein
MAKNKLYEGVARNVEWRTEGGKTVLTFKLEQVDDAGNVIASPQIMLRKKKINGSLSNGEEIELEARMSSDGFLKPRIIFNSSTKSFMLPPRMPITVIVAHLLSLALIASYIVWNTLQLKYIPHIILGGDAVVVVTPEHRPFVNVHSISALPLLALGFFTIAAIWTVIRIMQPARRQWLYKVTSGIPKELMAVIAFSLLNFLGAIAAISVADAKNYYVLTAGVRFYLLILIDLSLVILYLLVFRVGKPRVRRK